MTSSCELFEIVTAKCSQLASWGGGSKHNCHGRSWNVEKGWERSSSMVGLFLGFLCKHI